MNEQEGAKITILYEDADMLAIDKPAGVLVHSDGKYSQSRPKEKQYPTVVEWLLREYPDSQGIGEDPIVSDTGIVMDRSGIVHRLDRDTSGVMLLAKTSAGHAYLKAQFQNHSITKRYEALVYGAMKEDSYELVLPIGRAKTFGRWSAIPKAIRGNTREASTDFQVLRRYKIGSHGYTHLVALPHTGRTHQIRVHLQYLNYPIVADLLYAGKRNAPEFNLGLHRQALHAQSITFTNCAGIECKVEAPLPADMRQALEILDTNLA
ncbi:MAG: RluA family pseudouridine synthase [Patescibacteria group bacterium]